MRSIRGRAKAETQHRVIARNALHSTPALRVGHGLKARELFHNRTASTKLNLIVCAQPPSPASSVERRPLSRGPESRKYLEEEVELLCEYLHILPIQVYGDKAFVSRNCLIFSECVYS